jgi:hypothetical protein
MLSAVKEQGLEGVVAKAKTVCTNPENDLMLG